MEPISYDPYAMPLDGIEDPPATWIEALRKIGPGIILAGTIVGSGELILTTSFGAKHGFTFLWLILLSCVIKVFVQIELGRFAISAGKPTLGALDQIGTRFRIGRFLVWWWFVMLLCTVFQLGGMVGTVGQSLNAAWPDGTRWLASVVSNISSNAAELIVARKEYPWAFMACLVTIALIYRGTYQRIEWLTTLIVVTVTSMTVLAACSLWFTPFAFGWKDLGDGLVFHIPESGVADAFAIFGITGVGATELFYYPYWCLEKGYARYVGPFDGSSEWEKRARGWIRVMYLDAWISMCVFTLSTVAFYVMGAAVLHQQQLIPQKSELIEVLSSMFGEPFGPLARIAFLVGAGIVLFKTLYLACAANSRLTVDFLNLNGIIRANTAGLRQRWITRFCLVFPLLALGFYLFARDPQLMVKVGGIAQAATLPMIGVATLYFRYRQLHVCLRPSRFSDAMLWVAVLAIAAVAVYAIPGQLGSLGSK